MSKIINLHDRNNKKNKPNPPSEEVIDELIDLISKAMTGKDDVRRTKIVDDDEDKKEKVDSKKITDINKYKK